MKKSFKKALIYNIFGLLFWLTLNLISSGIKRENIKAFIILTFLGELSYLASVFLGLLLAKFFKNNV